MQKVIISSLSEITSESDVEQKFILPLLIGDAPLGFEYHFSDFKTKNDIRKIKIDKGVSSKYYFPDYAIIHIGLPLLIIEAKKPGEDLKEAYREARLYAMELNAQFPSKINPCHKIIVTDAQTTIAGFWDSENEIHTVHFDEVNTVSANFYEFSKFVSREEVFKYGESIINNLRGTTRYSRPLSLLGGKTVQNEEIQSNGFGATISLKFKYLFNPESFEERTNVVKNAYVKTKRLLKHVDPIEKVIRATIPIGSRNIDTIYDTSQPKEILTKFLDKKVLKNQLLLLVGSVGSGKSTFTDYLKEVALSDSSKEETIWVSLNLNLSPLSKEEIYKWLKQKITERLIDLHPEMDFEEAQILQRVYASEFQALRKGPASFHEANSEPYKKLFSDKLIELEGNLDLKTNAFVRYLCAERDKLLVIVLDNCDKRNLEDQLLMFDVANWLKSTFNCLVFLPLRDTTFDNFKKEPPLDTVIKDFVFRIDPPLLREVIGERIKYAFREMGKNNTKFNFTLPNGFIVEYPHTDQAYYLASIVQSLFENTYFGRLITGLAGRDIRKGLEIFLDFCKSGYINDAEIFKIRQSRGQYTLPNHIISRAIIRGNKKYFTDSNSTVKNLFSSHPEDTQPNPFARLSILKWLKDNLKKEGPSRAIGYHKISKLLNELIPYGHSDARLNMELSSLLRSKCITTESQSEESFDDEDLVSIAPAGIIHLELINDLNYLSACAEDVWFRELQYAEIIQKRITDKLGLGHLSKDSIIANSKTLIEYLINYKNNNIIAKPELFLEENKIVDYLELSKLNEIIERTSKNEVDEKTSKLSVHPIGSEYDGEVVSIQTYGIFVDIGLDSTGLVYVKNLSNKSKRPEDFDLGEIVRVIVVDYNSIHHSFDLKLV